MSVCTVEGCEKQIKAKGLCGMHHQRLTRWGAAGGSQSVKNIRINVDTIIFPKVKTMVFKKCNALNCEENSKKLGFCQKHLIEFKLDKWSFGHNDDTRRK